MDRAALGREWCVLVPQPEENRQGPVEWAEYPFRLMGIRDRLGSVFDGVGFGHRVVGDHLSAVSSCGRNSDLIGFSIKTHWFR